MLINELSKKTGITAHTIRFYEKSGLIKGERNDAVKSNNYFHYNEETVERLEFIREAKSVGFTISEISQIITAWYGDQYSKSDKLTLLDEKLASLEQKIIEIKEMKKLINQFKQDVLNDEC
jgi:MerR family Zn(II)-responsive transcriptional regulator of zntA